MQVLRRSDIKYTDSDFPATNLSKDNIEHRAEEVARQVDFHPESNRPVLDIVRAHGGRLHYQDLEDWAEQTGSIFVHAPFDFDIALPKYTSPRRDRFTIAHELGHYFLHASQGERPLIAHRAGTGRKEWEANWFAAALLMPREAFETAARRNPSPIALAKQFGVSRRAAEVRQEALGLVE